MIGSPALVPALPSPYLNWSAAAGNQLQGQAHGFELAADYRPSDTWRLQASYAYLDLNLKTRPGNTEINPLRAEGESPRHQASLISRHDLRHDLELDLQARYVSTLTTYSIPDYLTADLRLGWRATSRLDLAINGRNLIGPARKEFGTNIVNASDAYLIPREYYVTANLRF
jgi:iron complex outermembrane receptor protein